MSPLTAIPSVLSPALDGARESTSRSTPVSADTARAEPAKAVEQASTTTPASATVTVDSGSDTATSGDSPSAYSVHTSFDAATGDWALVIERHPPEVGVVVAEQKGFVSQYSARVNSPTNLQNAFSTRL